MTYLVPEVWKLAVDQQHATSGTAMLHDGLQAGREAYAAVVDRIKFAHVIQGFECDHAGSSRWVGGIKHSFF